MVMTVIDEIQTCARRRKQTGEKEKSVRVLKTRARKEPLAYRRLSKSESRQSCTEVEEEEEEEGEHRH